ncbi:MAG TPA: hypothetical protein PLU66_10370, partial [Trueperaceae bacterium]|nr:hypothetical protein [Trueperaceae bacterium]
MVRAKPTLDAEQRIVDLDGGAEVLLGATRTQEEAGQQSAGPPTAPGTVNPLAALASITTALSVDGLEAGLERSL